MILEQFWISPRVECLLPKWPEEVERSTDPSWKADVKESFNIINKVGEIQNCSKIVSVTRTRNHYIKFLSGHLKRNIRRIIFG